MEIEDKEKRWDLLFWMALGNRLGKGGEKEMQIKDIPMSKVIKVRYKTEEEREKILKALEVLNAPRKTLKYTG